MDVKMISQGGQSALDYNSSKNVNSSINNTDNGSTTINATEQSMTISNSKIDDVGSVKKAAEKMNKLLEGNSTHVEYEVDDNFKNCVVVRIVDDNTKQVIKEIPPKKLLDMIAKLCEMAGILVDQKA
jgi:flagellar protein FlaG